MQVVSNSSPLIALSGIDCLHLLKAQFGIIHIPNAVLQELKLDSGFPGSELIQNAIEEKWIQVQTVTDLNIVSLLKRDLDNGESEALSLAKTRNADLVLLDEKEARRFATTMELNSTGTIGIILKAYRKKEINDPMQLFHSLKKKVGFFISKSMMLEIQKEIKKDNP